jgi:selenocysteine-specific elongation factor
MDNDAGEVEQAVRYVVLGTAGHIDHGKTSLVRALTGIDCDTLAEEKQRGITINLGFAHWRPGPEQGGDASVEFGIVDVPGHQRFVRNMVAGAAGIDLLLLVVAADDGVMPQTLEHLHIARLLGVRRGVVALNKADLVDDELLELAREDVQQLLQGGGALAASPVVPVSAVTGQGFAELTAALIQAAAELPSRIAGERFRMPIDRSFSIRGAGTVVTGTTLAGVLHSGEEVQLLPRGKRARVRGIQLHGTAASQVGPGRRAALNLTGLDKEEASRGDVLVQPDSIIPTTLLDAEIELLPGERRPLRRGSEVLLHAGTAEINARLEPLEAETLASGQRGLVQLQLQQPAVLAAGDRFILRHSSSEFTVGGGSVLDAHPTRHRRQREAAAQKLATLGGTGSQLGHEIEKAQFGLSAAAAQLRLNLSPEGLRQALAELHTAQAGLVESPDGRQLLLTLPANRDRIEHAALSALQQHHAAHPLSRRGLDAQQLLRMVDPRAAGLSLEVLRNCLAAASTRGLLIRDGDSYALPGLQPKLSERDRKALQLLTVRFNASIQPDQPDEIVDELPVDKARLRLLLEYMVEEQLVILAPGGMYFGPQVVERARQALLRHFAGEDGISVSQFGHTSGATRKYSIPLLQLFEQDGMLVRDGDLRRLRPGYIPPEAAQDSQ